jgi:proton-dependent oligopeptide transporter, POT family
MSRLSQTLKKFPRVFWISNMMELFERWAWYGVYNSLALYLTLSKETGALGFTQEQKGLILGTGTALLYFLPLITGAIADRVGFKKVLIMSFTAYIAGFYMVGHFHAFPLVFAAYLFLACAGALFKPLISGTIAKTTNPETSSIGFGIFYMMVNIGAFIGPFIAGFIYKVSWNYVFLMSMCVIAINYIFVFFFYKEPGREPSEKSLLQNIGIAFKNIWITLNDWRYLLFLLIMSVFWAAYNQLFYSFPVFIEAWIDLDRIGSVLGLAAGKITAVTITSVDAFYIICLQLYISSLSMRLKPLYSIMTGILILSVGLFLMFNILNPWIILLGILVFSVGEMASSPKYTEYVGGIAPSDKKALYMGTSFLPLAVGHYAAGWISGKPYEIVADKLFLLKKAVAAKGFDIPDISGTFTQTDYFNRAQQLFGMDSHQLTQHLWNTYHPSKVWILYSGMALAASLMLFLYDKTILKGRVVSGK